MHCLHKTSQVAGAPNEKSDAREFLNFFEAIPEKRWITGRFTDLKDHSKHCAVGHLGMNALVVSSSAKRLQRLFSEFRRTSPRVPEHLKDYHFSVLAVNDGESAAYLVFGDTPKKRICNVLRLILNEPMKP